MLMESIVKKSNRFNAKRPGRAGQAGISMVEFAIVCPFALLVVMGIIQLGLMFSAKQLLNEAAFVAARAGSVQNAQVTEMRKAMVKAMVPFYQDTSDTDPATRVINALAVEVRELADLPAPFGNLDIDVLNPSADVFSDFGLTDSNNRTFIPNDNLEYRDNTPGASTGLTIRDANALKIRVTYAYELKVPLMQNVFKSVMCGFDTAVNAFGRGDTLPADLSNCARYYNRGRVPIVAYATVQMQSPARQ
jgi:TadE-like protein